MVPIEQSGKSVLLAELTFGVRQDPHGSRLSTEPFVSEKVAGQRYPHLSPRSAVRKLEALYRLSVMPMDGDNWNQILERKLQNTLLPTIVKKPASKKQTEAKQSTRKGSRALGKIDLDEGPDAPPIQQQIAAALRRNAGKVLDLFREWDANGDGEVSKKEFRKAMPAIGLDVSFQEVDALFDSWDRDAGGALNFKELSKVLKRPPSPRAIVKQSLLPTVAAASARLQLGIEDEVATGNVELAFEEPKPTPPRHGSSLPALASGRAGAANELAGNEHPVPSSITGEGAALSTHDSTLNYALNYARQRSGKKPTTKPTALRDPAVERSRVKLEVAAEEATDLRVLRKVAFESQHAEREAEGLEVSRVFRAGAARHEAEMARRRQLAAARLASAYGSPVRVLVERRVVGGAIGKSGLSPHDRSPEAEARAQASSMANATPELASSPCLYGRQHDDRQPRRPLPLSPYSQLSDATQLIEPAVAAQGSRQLGSVGRLGSIESAAVASQGGRQVRFEFDRRAPPLYARHLDAAAAATSAAATQYKADQAAKASRKTKQLRESRHEEAAEWRASTLVPPSKSIAPAVLGSRAAVDRDFTECYAAAKWVDLSPRSAVAKESLLRQLAYLPANFDFEPELNERSIADALYGH